MKKSFPLLLTLLITSNVLFAQAAPPEPVDNTPTYTYYPLFSEGWIGNKFYQGALECPTVAETIIHGSQIEEWNSFGFNSFNDVSNFKFSNETISTAPIIPTTQKEDAEWSLRCELLEFNVTANRVALNINNNDSKAAGPLVTSLHTLPSYISLQYHLSQNWDCTSTSYSVSPSRHELQKICTLLDQCKEDQLAILVTAAQFTTEESAQYNAFRALKSKIDSKNSITLSQFQFSSLEYINVLLARRVSVASGTAATDGFDALNEHLFNLNLNASDDIPIFFWSNNAAVKDCTTLCYDGEYAMLEYERKAAPAIEWNL